MNELRKAWAIGDVRLGLLGTLLITIGSLTPAYLPQASPLWTLLRAMRLAGQPVKIIGTVIVLLGLVLLIEAWFRMRAERNLRHWAVLLIWSIPLLVSPPVFSHDAYSYAAHGWLLHNHLNPYDVGPGILPGAFADQVAWVWRRTTTPYGPLSLMISWGLDALAGFDPFWSAMMMRIPALVGVGLIGFFLPKIANIWKLSSWQIGWLGIINPVLVIDFVGGAHNDALMVGLVVFAIWITVRIKYWVLGAIVVGVSMAIKQPALLAAVALPFIVRPWTSWRVKPLCLAIVKIVSSVGLAVGVFIGITFISGLGFGWINAVNVPGKVITVSPFTIAGWLAQQLFDWLLPAMPMGIALTAARIVGLLVAITILLYLAVTKLGRQPIYFLSWSWIWLALCAPAFHSWYVMWGGVLLPLTKPSQKTIRVAIWATMIMLVYAAINLSNRNESLALGVATVGAVYWQLHTHHRKYERNDTNV